MPKLTEQYPSLRVLWEGQEEQTKDSMNSMLYGFIAVLIAMYLLFRIEFKSYLQPFLVLSIIPFGACGAIFGHVVMGLPLSEAIIEAGRRRCRPVLLTSLTTIGGMLPILLETSRQAQVLIPMATSLSFGLVFGTVLVLILAPVGFFVIAKTQNLFAFEDAGDESPESVRTVPAA